MITSTDPKIEEYGRQLAEAMKAYHAAVDAKEWACRDREVMREAVAPRWLYHSVRYNKVMLLRRRPELEKAFEAYDAAVAVADKAKETALSIVRKIFGGEPYVCNGTCITTARLGFGYRQPSDVEALVLQDGRINVCGRDHKTLKSALEALEKARAARQKRDEAETKKRCSRFALRTRLLAWFNHADIGMESHHDCQDDERLFFDPKAPIEVLLVYCSDKLFEARVCLNGEFEESEHTTPEKAHAWAKAQVTKMREKLAKANKPKKGKK